MRLTLKTIWVLALVVSIIACGGTGSESGGTTTKTPASKMDSAEDAALLQRIKNGKKLYITHCGAACHQVDGKGLAGSFPPLVETKWVMGDKEVLIDIVLNGLQGEIEVKGVKYNQIMAALPYLKDQEVADILTYVRDRWGKGASPVTPEEVAKVRG